MYNNMKIFPILLLGMLILPESMIFSFGKVEAHPIRIDDTQDNVAAAATTTTTTTTTMTSQGKLECDACMYLANGLNQTIIHNPKVIAIVSDDLEKICSVLPQSVQALCTSAVEQTTPVILNHLGDFIATEGCADLGVCHTTHSLHTQHSK